jgi:TonB-linked SusC/RagA family outer membrane protein
MVRGDKDYYKRLTAQINADYKIKKWFTVGTNTSIERYDSQAVSEHSEYSNGANGTSLLGTLIIDPLTPVYYTSYDQLPGGMKAAVERGANVLKNEDGYYYATSKMEEGDGGNPLVFRDRNNNTSEGFNIRGTVYANITPIKNLVFTSRFGYRIAQGYSSNYVDPYYLNSKLYYETYELTKNSSQSYYYQWENFANYNINLGKHAIGAMAGMSYTFNDSRNVQGQLTGSDILTGYEPNFRYFAYTSSNAVKSISGSENQSTQISYFGRLTYSYDNRYSAQVNFRADAFDSSKLSKKSRWGYFPSVSVGWTVSNEPWFEGVKDALSLNFLKFRASWGVNGNIAVARDYKYSTSISYNSTNYQFDPDVNTLTYGSRPSGVANPDLKWETSVQKDFGMDARFFGNRLTIGADYFIKDTDGLIVNITPIAEAGITSSTVNAGSIRNKGFEFEAGWQDQIGDFRYSLNGNLSTLDNVVTYLEPSVGRQTGSNFSNHYNTPAFEQGHSTWYMRALEYAGVDKATGEPLFISGDGRTIHSSEVNTSTDLKDVGSTVPTLTYGVTLNLAWKSFDLVVFGSGAAGNVISPCVYRTQHPRINSLAYFYENAWTPSNTNASMPSIASIQQDTNFWSSTANIFKGDYFKIKQIQLGYTLPVAFAKKVGLSNLRVYTSLDDWFLFTKYPGFDPETASTGSYNGAGMDKGSYPNAKRLILGVNVSF